LEALAAISSPQPEFSESVAKRTLEVEYGLEGALAPLVSERDQNFRVSMADGRQFVFKIANRAESSVTTDFQIKALLHIEQMQCSVATPRIVRTLAGNDSALVHDGDVAYVCRVVSYLQGTLLSEISTSPQLAQKLGECAARLDMAMADFEHPGDSPLLLWDLQRAAGLRDLLPYIEEATLRAAVTVCLDDFDACVEPALPALRRQVIHSDLHGDNVLADADHQNAIAGVIDFGDMVRAPLIMEVAVAASYLRNAQGDALSLIAPFVNAYNSLNPLQAEELELLFDLVRARLAATISILRWRVAQRGEDDQYASLHLQIESGAEAFLLRLDSLGRSEFLSVINKCIKNS
jgi:Ser/Thr protein kinase RdoA (MazF antagonist)